MTPEQRQLILSILDEIIEFGTVAYVSSSQQIAEIKEARGAFYQFTEEETVEDDG